MSSIFLTSVFTRFGDRLRGLAAGIAGAREADDVVHDAFCRLWERHPQVNSEREAMRLSYTAVRNRAIDAYRNDRAHLSSDIADHDFADEEAESERTKSETYRAVIRLAQKHLKPKAYEIFQLHDIEGYSYEEVALRLDITQENVRMTLSRARRTIRELYRQQNQEL